MGLPAAWQTLAVTAPAPHVTLLTLNRPAGATAPNTPMGPHPPELWDGHPTRRGAPRAGGVGRAGGGWP